jgi:nucleotide-binding universal stress UspA family protein
MYKTIYVPVDNSDHSNRAVELAVDLGKAFESKLVGCHVYAARMHDYRFKQMEFTLPEEYLEETELERQRKIHDSLITMGLKLISDSYLSAMAAKCHDAGLEFEPRMMDGKHSTEIIKDIEAQGYDLVVMGSAGVGRTRASQLGSVCERVARSSTKDLWVVKELPSGNGARVPSDTILVGVDGSPQSFGALVTAIELAKGFGKKVEAVAVYDPYLHYSVFKGIVDVLTEKAAKVFRFEEQNQLHEEIIDTGLAQIYQSHLDVAEKVAEERGVAITKTLLDGKAFQKVLDHAQKTKPWLLVLGRIGIHNSKDERGLGSNSENLLRLSPCDVLLTTGLEVPSLDVRAEEAIRWTPEAEERFRRVPPLVRGIARTATFRLALEKGHSVITNSVLQEAMDRYMPKHSGRATEQLAGELIVERSRAGISICRKCGVAAQDAHPVKCSVCGGRDFQVITQEMVEEIIRMEGGSSEELAYDGRKLTWTLDARKALATIKDGYRRRRTKARIEKAARLRRMEAVSLEFAGKIIEEETGETLVLLGRTASDEAAISDSDAPTDGRRLVARDDKRNPLLSQFDWTDEAIARVFRVPAGFMRNRTQERIESLARERVCSQIDLALVEEGIEFGRALMAQMIESYGTNPEKARASLASDAAPGGEVRDPGGDRQENVDPPPPLNEVGILSSLKGGRPSE